MSQPSLVIKQEMPALRVFGCFFVIFCIGIVTISALGGSFTVNNRPGTPLEEALFKLAFFTATILLLGYRRGATLDSRSRMLTTWHGLFMPLWKRRYRLDDVESISLKESLNSTQEKGFVEYSLWARGKDISVRCYKSGNMKKARHEAERMARFLRVSLTDATDGRSSITQPEELGESLRARAQRTGLEHPWPVPPDNFRITLRSEAGLTALQLPPRGFQIKPASIIQSIPLLLMGGWFMNTFYIPISTGGKGAPEIGSAPWFFLFGLSNLFLLVFLIPILILGAQFLFKKNTEILICTSEDLKVIRSGIFGKESSIPVSDLMGLRLIEAGPHARARPKKGLILETTAQDVTVGTYLEQPEVEWLRESLLHLIVHGPLA